MGDLRAIEKSEFLKQKIEKQISSFKRRKEHNQTKAVRTKLISILLAASTTVLLGLKGLNESGQLIVQNLAFVLSAAVTFVTGLDAYFDHQGLWVRYQGTLNDLYELKTDLEYLLVHAAGEVPENELDQLYRRYQVILRDTNSTWSSLRKEQTS
ncbi:DUF4231 domain-containing protein [Nodosilinea sp. FACHB-13]|uniref:DUF4231 domain-containing protein n=1 Tax=Cyanophyceae TaxID=3028117 RepID=UPI0016831701|nr:DUF4231 domain-containing protein [Nodosilinea sp. FACHB-13]MBD2107803.1 DUF4231 domain-containing protein [Nodosilinea sp. FACHB-13]